MQPLALVTSQLESYAQRGVFRSFSRVEADSRNRRTEFRFCWLWNLPFSLSFDGTRKELAFRNLLPDVPAGSELNNRLKAFIRSRSSSGQPEHRRIDAKRVTVRCTRRQGNVSIVFRIVRSDYQYGVKMAMHLVNELLVGFLNVHLPEYMAQHFHRRED